MDNCELRMVNRVGLRTISASTTMRCILEIRYWLILGGFALLGLAHCQTTPQAPTAVPPSLPPQITTVPLNPPTAPPPVISVSVTRQAPPIVPTATDAPPPAVLAADVDFALPPPPEPIYEQTLGMATNGDPIVALRVGTGPHKIVVAGINRPIVNLLYATFSKQPERVPNYVSLWFVPALNPAHRNMLFNADTRFDACAGNDWSRRENGETPFSLPEARALRDFGLDAHIVLLFHLNEWQSVLSDTCGQHAGSAAVAANLAATLGFDTISAPRGNNGFMVDYLTGAGVAAVSVSDSESSSAQNEALYIDALTNLMVESQRLFAEPARQQQAAFTELDKQQLGQWHYAPNSFVHPIALELVGETAYLLDSGRVLALNIAQPSSPQTILQAGDLIEEVPVLEPVDLAADGSHLYVLDRAGDTYRYDTASRQWALDRYDRLVRDISAHYYVGLDAADGKRTLLETSYQFAYIYDEVGGRLWNLEDGRLVDVSATDDSRYVLMETALQRYRSGERDEAFRPNFTIRQPRQLVATASALFLLDEAGRRLLIIDPETGQLREMMQFNDRTAISALWSNGTLPILASRDVLYFVGQPARLAIIGGGQTLPQTQPHDERLLSKLGPYVRPIQGTELAERDFQMSGAPRHYRLGIHEGFDFYWQNGTQVQAVASGTVIRATHDWVPPEEYLFDFYLGQSYVQGATSEDAEDFFRGRQIWIEHDDGTVARYVHLSSISWWATEGARVEAGQVIGQVGNSGSPASRGGDNRTDSHLHFELRIGDGYLGQHFRPIETRAWLQRLFP